MSDKERPPPLPRETLGTRGSAFWNDVAEEWDLRPDELEILGAACRTLDLIQSMEQELEGQPRTVRGSQGQPVINPLVSELRFYRAALASHLRALRIPDDDESEDAEIIPLEARKMTRSEAGKAGAAGRWKKRGYQ